ncbi:MULTISPECIES: DeoR/GlpR family transcriptional regulator [unclassified Colwellia]|uniref:DeoR/GlpR family transcriptional regulator n=1 Tax=unclassified Colwellia TaxID=196834 RepID=UPI0015F776C8|nr:MULTISPECIES: DeoR/GlpR family transcriptional regulator [unclassified Colwellia]MBA6347542.1 DeoR/GlpR family transcriptional regulator [Colwellia sp. BRX8-9]MBA6351685.1 DeoR/GlpR family transcriptional regulator [Colwellia sp. BRX9-1]MBA6356739.1 DeoR/GlpR family transcriptional regulator [Colwellia sp. BRX8-3]MBA6359068.1 DeoR/GlpR family transcriptional regulator [Colwellia sp. BRX8-6]MBA6368477.1 DeoR/GlpR family transcriptional regulator [Colwellia sp. BRX8-5]|tara:strand:+ start:2757 stop:3515 length:759 start_codon:yes stop_codon:yes gene_type:complete
MTQQQRQALILEMIKKSGFVSIDELVEHFKVTPQTVRRDLNQLAKVQKISRHHGGAGIESSTVNTDYQTRKIMDLQAKEKIAAELVRMIPNGASLFINIGTTTETIARALLDHKSLQIVTNNLNVASILGAKEDFSVVIAGGEVRHRDGGVIGETTEDFIKNFRMDFGIIGISGIDIEGSLLDFDYREVRVAQAIIANSRQVILAADHSKFGRNAMVRLGNINQADHFFTDAPPPDEIQKILSDHNVTLHLV